MTPWLAKVFDRPVADPPWFDRDCDEDIDRLTDVDWFRALVDVLSDLPPVAHRFSNEQLAQGLEYMASPRSPSMFGYRDAGEQERIRFAELSVELYRDIFAKRCDLVLGHLNEEGNALNDACYMWFDWLSDAYIEFEGLSSPFPGQEALVDACREILTLGHVACDEGALHGLGHLASYFPDRVKVVVSEYLERTAEGSSLPELREYAHYASTGDVL